MCIRDRNNYVELEQEEMMYLNVGLRSQLGRFCGGVLKYVTKL